MSALYVERILIVLRNLINISKIAPKKPLFNFQDIENALFLSKNPEFIVYPFSYKLVRKTSITFEIPFIHKEELKLSSILSCIKKINNKSVSKRDVDKISTTYLHDINKKFFEAVDIWRSYVIDNAKEFCNTEISIINWKTFQNTNTDYQSCTFLQKLWISINAQKDKDFWMKTAIDIRESLLPWMNHDLWTKIEKDKVNKRENVAYDAQKKAMVEGELQNLNKTPENLDKKNEEEDLDIIT